MDDTYKLSLSCLRFPTSPHLLQSGVDRDLEGKSVRLFSDDALEYVLAVNFAATDDTLSSGEVGDYGSARAKSIPSISQVLAESRYMQREGSVHEKRCTLAGTPVRMSAGAVRDEAGSHGPGEVFAVSTATTVVAGDISEYTITARGDVSKVHVAIRSKGLMDWIRLQCVAQSMEDGELRAKVVMFTAGRETDVVPRGGTPPAAAAAGYAAFSTLSPAHARSVPSSDPTQEQLCIIGVPPFAGDEFAIKIALETLVAGEFEVLITCESTTTKTSSPLPLKVDAANVSAAHCNIFGLALSDATACVENKFHVRTRDRFGNIVSNDVLGHGNVKVQCSIQHVGTKAHPSEDTLEVSCKYDGDGVTAVTFMPHAAGKAMLDVAVITEDGVAALTGSPYEVVIKPGPPDLAASRAFGKGLEAGVTKGSRVRFTVQLFDAAGNECNADPHRIAVTLAGEAMPSVFERRRARVFHGSGRPINERLCEYYTDGVGSLDVHVTIDEQPLHGSPFSVTVMPTIALAKVTMPKTARLGQWSEIELSLKDEKGRMCNYREGTKPPFSIKVAKKIKRPPAVGASEESDPDAFPATLFTSTPGNLTPQMLQRRRGSRSSLHSGATSPALSMSSLSPRSNATASSPLFTPRSYMSPRSPLSPRPMTPSGRRRTSFGANYADAPEPLNVEWKDGRLIAGWRPECRADTLFYITGVDRRGHKMRLDGAPYLIKMDDIHPGIPRTIIALGPQPLQAVAGEAVTLRFQAKDDFGYEVGSSATFELSFLPQGGDTDACKGVKVLGKPRAESECTVGAVFACQIIGKTEGKVNVMMHHENRCLTDCNKCPHLKIISAPVSSDTSYVAVRTRGESPSDQPKKYEHNTPWRVAVGQEFVLSYVTLDQYHNPAPARCTLAVSTKAGLLETSLSDGEFVCRTTGIGKEEIAVSVNGVVAERIALVITPQSTPAHVRIVDVSASAGTLVTASQFAVGQELRVYVQLADKFNHTIDSASAGLQVQLSTKAPNGTKLTLREAESVYVAKEECYCARLPTASLDVHGRIEVLIEAKCGRVSSEFPLTMCAGDLDIGATLEAVRADPPVTDGVAGSYVDVPLSLRDAAGNTCVSETVLPDGLLEIGVATVLDGVDASLVKVEGSYAIRCHSNVAGVVEVALSSDPVPAVLLRFQFSASSVASPQRSYVIRGGVPGFAGMASCVSVSGAADVVVRADSVLLVQMRDDFDNNSAGGEAEWEVLSEDPAVVISSTWQEKHRGVIAITFRVEAADLTDSPLECRGRVQMRHQGEEDWHVLTTGRIRLCIRPGPPAPPVVTVEEYGASHAVVSWLALELAGTPALSMSFYVAKDESGEGAQKLSCPSERLCFRLEGLELSTTYYLQAVAESLAGPSVPTRVSFKTLGLPSPPLNLTAVPAGAGEDGSATLQLNWTDGDGAGLPIISYIVHAVCEGSEGLQYELPGNEAVLGRLEAATQYTLSIFTMTEAGASEALAITAVTKPVLQSPEFTATTTEEDGVIHFIITPLARAIPGRRELHEANMCYDERRFNEAYHYFLAAKKATGDSPLPQQHQDRLDISAILRNDSPQETQLPDYYTALMLSTTSTPDEISRHIAGCSKALQANLDPLVAEAIKFVNDASNALTKESARERYNERWQPLAPALGDLQMATVETAIPSDLRFFVSMAELQDGALLHATEKEVEQAEGELRVKAGRPMWLCARVQHGDGADAITSILSPPVTLWTPMSQHAAAQGTWSISGIDTCVRLDAPLQITAACLVNGELVFDPRWSDVLSVTAHGVPSGLPMHGPVKGLPDGQHGVHLFAVELTTPGPHLVSVFLEETCVWGPAHLTVVVGAPCPANCSVMVEKVGGDNAVLSMDLRDRYGNACCGQPDNTFYVEVLDEAGNPTPVDSFNVATEAATGQYTLTCTLPPTESAWVGARAHVAIDNAWEIIGAATF